VFAELERLNSALKAYIEANYHISNPALVALRRAVLDKHGTIFQRAFVESTPLYRGVLRFADLAIPDAAKQLLTFLGSSEGGNLLFDPPYPHQAKALEIVAGDAAKCLLATTGTGSGKTETFLLPIMAKLAAEAAGKPDQFATRAMRAVILYPMNALVNDQLGRLRTLFGAEQVRAWFTEKAGRPMKFARYTGRSLYAGVRSQRRNETRLKSLNFYRDLEKEAQTAEGADALIKELRKRGRWPAKPNATDHESGMTAWLGSNRRWLDANGHFQRAIERPEDAELLLRHEVQDAPPDLLITNYSMLEYMLLRPIERPIFEATRAYLEAYPHEKLLFVLDEAHLYRGAGGTEVALLIRRLRNRLGLTPERLQVIATSASFSDPVKARHFIGGLVGRDVDDIEVLTGEKHARTPSGEGDAPLAAALSACTPDRLRDMEPEARMRAVLPLLAHRRSVLRASPLAITSSTAGVKTVTVTALAPDLTIVEEIVPVQRGIQTETQWDYLLTLGVTGADEVQVGRAGWTADLIVADGVSQVLADGLQRLVHDALSDLPVVGRLVNLTGGARTADDVRTGDATAPLAIDAINSWLFPASLDPEIAHRATDALLELASYAKPKADGAPLLAARVHTLFRGLPGLWACADEACTALPAEMDGTPTGALYAQSHRTCACNARVFALHTCRDCGVAYFHAFTLNPSIPDYLWAEDVGDIEDVDGVIRPIQILLEDPGYDADSYCVAAFLDPLTGRIGSKSKAARPVWLPRPGAKIEPGHFEKCPHCSGRGSQIMDHQTKGDEPFQELISVQLLDQPARPEATSPLQGRKSLIFSDGRQAASRLSGKLKDFSLRDSIRPLLLAGFELLEKRFEQDIALGHAYPAILFACARYGVTFRLPGAEHADFARDLRRVHDFLAGDNGYNDFCDLAASLNKTHVRAIRAPLAQILSNRHTGLLPLALAAPEPLLTENQRKRLHTLPAPAGEDSEKDRRKALLNLWCTLAMDASAVLIEGTPSDWIDATEGPKYARTNGRFTGVLEPLFGQKWHRAQFGAGARPETSWIGFLSDTFGQNANVQGFFVTAGKLRLRTEREVDWRRCSRCTRAQPFNALLGETCIQCEGETAALDPRCDTVFRTRKYQYRKLVERLEAEGDSGYVPHPFVAEEHTAQLNDAGQDQAFSRAEWYELRFQDLDVPGPRGERAGAVDVLSCTTTMEVGIDIGSLTAVALRNVPPGRANYQQRAGRAGRRGSSLSTVLTFAGSDSHDQRYFRDPAAMVGGPVPDPVLKLDNLEIVERHAFALMLSMFQQDRIGMPPEDADGPATNIFESLGTLPQFRAADVDGFTFVGLEAWLGDHAAEVDAALRDIIPPQAVRGAADGFFAQLPRTLLAKLEMIGAAGETEVIEANMSVAADEGPAFDFGLSDFDAEGDQFAAGDYGGDGTVQSAHAAADSNPEAPLKPENLLDRLFACAVLPRYAFPTDVVSFTVFDQSSTPYRAELAYSPQTGLSQALSQYAPGREVWVDGRRFRSMAIWSPFHKDRINAYRAHRLYYECVRCGYAKLEHNDDVHHTGRTETCPACNKSNGMGPAERWIVPVGFAHPHDEPVILAGDETPPTTRPTRAKLTAPNFKTEQRLGERLHESGAGFTAWSSKETLVVTNLGVRTNPSATGFYYCTACGRTEPTGWPDGKLMSGHPHRRPYPNHGKQPELCGGAVRPIVLGHEFLTDIALFSFRLAPELHIPPGSTAGRIVLTTVAEALSAAAAAKLDIDTGDIGGGNRAALNEGGARGSEVEIFLYDTAPGGAGFVRSAAEQPIELLEAALVLLENCECPSSCYRCLRSHKNRWDHADLDRHLGASFLRHVLYAERPFVPDSVEERLLSMLKVDLADSGCDADLRADGTLVLAAHGDRSIVISHPMMRDRPGSRRADARGATPTDRFIDQLLVERALPVAVQRVLEADTIDAARSSPPFETASKGVPVYRSLASLAAAGALPPADMHAVLPDAPTGSFVIQLDVETMENTKLGNDRPFTKGNWHLFVPTQEPIRKPMLVRRTDGGDFQASGSPVTLALVGTSAQQDCGARLRMSYASLRPNCRFEQINADKVEFIGVFERVLGR
jgi:hypothetical protein